MTSLPALIRLVLHSQPLVHHLLNRAIQVLHNVMGGEGEGVKFPDEKGAKMRYEGVLFNIVRVTRGWVSNFQKKALHNT